jgi:hypothetical protein
MEEGAMATVRALEDDKKRRVTVTLCEIMFRKVGEYDDTEVQLKKLSTAWMQVDAQGRRVNSIQVINIVDMRFERLLLEDSQVVFERLVREKVIDGRFRHPVATGTEMERIRAKIVHISQLWHLLVKYLTGSYDFFLRVFKASPEQVVPIERDHLMITLMNWSEAELEFHLEHKELWSRLFLWTRCTPSWCSSWEHLDPEVHSLADMIELVYKFARQTFSQPFTVDMFKNMTKAKEIAIHDTSGTLHRLGAYDHARGKRESNQERIATHFWMNGVVNAFRNQISHKPVRISSTCKSLSFFLVSCC